MPATADVTNRCANGNSVNGTATHSTATATTRARSSRAIDARADGRNASAAAPKPIRIHVTSPGSNARRASSISRNEAPQISPMPRNRDQSPAENAPA